MIKYSILIYFEISYPLFHAILKKNRNIHIQRHLFLSPPPFPQLDRAKKYIFVNNSLLYMQIICRKFIYLVQIFFTKQRRVQGHKKDMFLMNKIRGQGHMPPLNIPLMNSEIECFFHFTDEKTLIRGIGGRRQNNFFVQL